MFSKQASQSIKLWHLILVGVIITSAIGLKIYSIRWPTAEIIIGNNTINVLVANTMPRRIEGWSNKEDMGKYHGMLFVFSDRGQHTMVMRDMQFALDIVWIDGGTIADIAPNIQPEPGRAEAQLTPYFSRLPSTLVLELPAGFAQANGVKIGDKIAIKRN